MGADYGVLAKLGIDTANPVTARFDFMSEGMLAKSTMEYGGGLRGTRSRDVSRVREGPRRIAGPITLQPDAVELALLLPWILGGTPTGGPTFTYPVANALPSRYVTLDRIIDVYTYNSVFVNKATFSASEGRMLQVVLDLVGVDETIGAAGTFPAISIDVANTPWLFEDAVISVTQPGSGATVTFAVTSNVITSVTTTPVAGGTGYRASATFPLLVTGGSGTGGYVLATTNSSGVITAFSATPVAGGTGYTGTTGAATSAASPYQAKNFALTIDNKVDTARFFNSLTLSPNTNAMDRQVSLSMSMPHGDAMALYNAGPGGTNIVLTLTNGGAILTATMSKVVWPRETPTAKSRAEIMLPINGSAYANGATAEIVWTLNPGP